MADIEDGNRVKRASVLLALFLAALAVILTTIYLEADTQGPTVGSAPRTRPSVGSDNRITPPPGDGVHGTVQCRTTGSRVPGVIICPANFTIDGSAAGLYPGKTLQLPVVVTNPDEHGILVMNIVVSVAGTSTPSCGVSNLATANYEGPGVAVPGNGSGTISLPITMVRAAPDACQNVTFTLSYSGTAEPV